MATGGGCCGASPPLVVESAVRTRRVGRKCLRRKRGAATGTVVGDRARPGPARTAARAGAPQIHQVLLLDLQWGANCRPARRDARRGAGMMP